MNKKMYAYHRRTAVSQMTSGDGYEYTMPTGVMTNEQRDFYDKNGYLMVRRLVEPDVLERCRKHFVDICEGRAPKPFIMMKEIELMKTGLKGENIINKIQEILYDDVFSEYFEHKKVLDIVSNICGPSIRGMHSMLINKPPGSGRHPSHQDLHYFPFRPANKVVASWTAMETVNKDNGCLFVVPASHRVGILYAHDYPREKLNAAFHGIVNEDEVSPENRRLYVPMETGDTLFFHPLLVHGSGPNVTKRFRKAISCHYMSDDCHYIDVKGTTQENIEQESLQLAKILGYPGKISYQDIWRFKSKLIRDARAKI